MAQFTFSMQALLKLKEAAEKDAKSALGRAIAKVSRLEEERLAMLASLEKETLLFEEKRRRGITAGEYQSNSDYVKSIRVGVSEMEERLREARAEQFARQEALQEIYREKKTLEKLREEQYKEFLKQEKAKESKSVEDVLRLYIVSASSANTA